MGAHDTLRGRYLAPAAGLRWGPRHARRLLSVAGSACAAGPVASSLPAAVNIDVSDACNLACRVCSRELGYDRRQRAFFPLADFERLVAELRPAYLLLSGYGEPLLHRALPALVAAGAATGAQVALVTNGTLLDADRGAALRGAGLARLKVSLDAARPEPFAKMREGGDLDVILDNVRAFVAAPGPTQVEVQMVLSQDNLDELLPMLALCAGLGLQPNFLGMFTYGGQPGFVERALPGPDPAVLSVLEAGVAEAEARGMRRSEGALRQIIRGLDPSVSRAPCYMPWYQVTISTDGEVYACCHHSVGGKSLGNAVQHGFAAVWNGEAAQGFRARLRADRRADPVCAACRHDDSPLEPFLAAGRRLPAGLW